MYSLQLKFLEENDSLNFSLQNFLSNFLISDTFLRETLFQSVRLEAYRFSCENEIYSISAQDPCSLGMSVRWVIFSQLGKFLKSYVCVA